MNQDGNDPVTPEQVARAPLRPGTLYLVATPIGNLEDITLRALRVLKECDVIAAEDTRRTGLLLRHFGISKPILSCFKFNESKRASEILDRLAKGQTVALVTDSGTPGISDPGQLLVRKVIDAGFRVEPIPGPCALIAAVSACGLPTNEFHFIGFLPHKGARRQKALERLKTIPGTLVIYESPHRILRLFQELAQIFPTREIVVARELTKKFEEFQRGSAKELLDHFLKHPPKGEFVILISPLADEITQISPDSESPSDQAHV